MRAGMQASSVFSKNNLIKPDTVFEKFNHCDSLGSVVCVKIRKIILHSTMFTLDQEHAA